MVNMTDGAHITVWLSPLKLLLCHLNPPFVGAHNQTRTGDPVLTKNVLYQLSYVGTFTDYLDII